LSKKKDYLTPDFVVIDPVHLLPSGLVSPKCINLIGTGVVFHLKSFFDELDDLEKKGLASVRKRIFVSDRCHVSLDLHAAIDGLEEVEVGTSRS
jgi:adenylosuccinate synthase